MLPSSSPGTRRAVRRTDRDSDRIERQLRTVRWGPVPSWAKALDEIHPPLLGTRAVSREVNRVGTNSPQLIQPLAGGHADEIIQLRLVS